MRTSAHRFTRAAIAAATAISLTAGAVQPAVADEGAPAGVADKPAAPGKTSLSSDATVTVHHKQPDGTTTPEIKTLPGYTQTSAALGSAELQDWYNDSPQWAQYLLSALFVALALDIIGTLLGPVRSAIFNVIRDNNLPIPVPPRP